MSVLEKLGSVESGEDRRALGREVANLFFAAEKRGISVGQKDEFGEILGNLLSAMDLGAREELSDRMADSVEAPRSLMMQMAQDEVSVATPVLQRSQILTDDDLIEVSANATVQHRLVLSKRENLSSQVTDELISHEEKAVMCAVASNPTAHISDTGFNTLAQHGADDEELAKTLASRANLPTQVAEQILPALDAKAKKNLMELMAGGYSDKLEKVVAQAKGTSARNRITTKSKRLQAKAMSKDIEDGVKKMEEIAVQLAKENRPADLSYVFSQISMLSESKTFHAITDPNGDLLALICRAFDMSFSGYLIIEAMRLGMLKLPATDEGALQKRFEAVTAQDAQKTMRFVNVIIKSS